jgi:hypothetical protein
MSGASPNKSVSNYLSQIGRRGGKKSRRKLDPVFAKNMTRIREARRAFKNYHTQCFWSFNPDYVIRLEDVQWVSEQLKKNGDRRLWQLGVKLCR